MKNHLRSLIISVILFFSALNLQAQDYFFVCPNQAIQVDIASYYMGDIYWEYSYDSNTWGRIEDLNNFFSAYLPAPDPLDYYYYVRAIIVDEKGFSHVSDTIAIYIDEDCIIGDIYTTLNIWGDPSTEPAVCNNEEFYLWLSNIDDTQNNITWQYKNGTNWVSMANSDTSYFATKTTTTRTYRALIKGAYCKDLYSSEITVTVSTSGLCNTSSAALYFTVPVPVEPLTSNTYYYDVCDANGGSIYSYSYGGALPILYSKDNGVSFQETYYFEGLSAGTYNYIIKDANGCTIKEKFTIESGINPPAILTTPEGPKDVFNSDYSEYKTNEQSDIYQYEWDITPPEAGSIYGYYNTATVYWNYDYTGTADIKVRGTNYCYNTNEYSNTIRVIVRGPIGIAMDITHPACGDSSGSAKAIVSGLSGKISYQWSNGDTTQTAKNLPAGIYQVTVKDATGFSYFDIATLSDIGGPQLELINKNNNNCSGDKQGSIDINVTGGTLPYKYLWSNGSSSQDISLLQGGSYEVIVKDAKNCQSNARYIIEEPESIIINLNTVNPQCGNSNGSISALVSGGFGTYSYLWSNNATESNLTGLTAGSYGIKVTDGNNCSKTSAATLTSKDGPIIKIDSIKNAGCINANGSAYISISGTTSPYTYKWSNNSISQNLLNVLPGKYTVTVTDKNNCESLLALDILKSDKPLPQPICVVTVDSTTGKNLILWNKVQTSGVASYNIYKETTKAGNYQKIGTVAFEKLSKFVDTLSNSKSRAWRYKMSAVNECGLESSLSEEHKTMHLVLNLGLNNTVNLIWDDYQGFIVETYDILRYSQKNGWEKIESIPSNLHSYRDDQVPAGPVDYVVSATTPASCFAEGILKIKEGPYSSSISNLEDNRLKAGGIGFATYEGNALSVYPNPASTEINIGYYGEGEQTLYLRDAMGRSVKSVHLSGQGYQEKTIDINELVSGIYFIQITTDSGSQLYKIIKE